MVRVITVLTGIAPGNVHFTSRQIDHHGVNGLLTVERIGPIRRVVTDRVGLIDVILLHRLHGFDGVFRALSQESIGAVITHP